MSLWFFSRRLQQHAFKVDVAAIFVIGLQTVWLAWRLIPAGLQESAIAITTKLTNSQNESWVLLSVALFPYLIFMVAVTNQIYRTPKRELANFGDRYTLLLGILLSTIALVNPRQAIAIFSLWLVSTLIRRGEELAAIYAIVTDKWAIALCGFELLTLTLHSLLVYQRLATPEFFYLQQFSGKYTTLSGAKAR